MTNHQLSQDKTDSKTTPRKLRNAREVMERTGKHYGWENKRFSREPISEEGKKWLR